MGVQISVALSPLLLQISFLLHPRVAASCRVPNLKIHPCCVRLQTGLWDTKCITYLRALIPRLALKGRLMLLYARDLNLIPLCPSLVLLSEGSSSRLYISEGPFPP